VCVCGLSLDLFIANPPDYRRCTAVLLTVRVGAQ